MDLSISQVVLLLFIALLGGLVGNLAAVYAKYPNQWSFFWSKSRLLYSQSITHGVLSAIIFYIFFEFIGIQLTLGNVALQNNYFVAFIIGLISRTLYDFKLGSFSSQELSINSLLPFVKNFDAKFDVEQWEIVEDEIEKRCTKYNNDIPVIKPKLINRTPNGKSGDAFKDDVNSGKYPTCNEMMHEFAILFGKEPIDSAFP
jgi:hypothetical protein